MIQRKIEAFANAPPEHIEQSEQTELAFALQGLAFNGFITGSKTTNQSGRWYKTNVMSNLFRKSSIFQYFLQSVQIIFFRVLRLFSCRGDRLFSRLGKA
jgi:hypothetical protein